MHSYQKVVQPAQLWRSPISIKVCNMLIFTLSKHCINMHWYGNTQTINLQVMGLSLFRYIHLPQGGGNNCKLLSSYCIQQHIDCKGERTCNSVRAMSPFIVTLIFNFAVHASGLQNQQTSSKLTVIMHLSALLCPMSGQPTCMGKVYSLSTMVN